MIIRIVAVTVTCLFLASPVRADVESRPATEAEIVFMNKVHSAFLKAAPKSGPAGWEESERTSDDISDSVAKGVEGYPMRLDYQLKWVDSAKYDAARQKTEDFAGGHAAASTGADPALQLRYEQLAAKIGAAAEKGDMKAIERLQKEMDAVGQKMNKPFEEGERKVNAASKALAPRDAYAKLSLAVNESWLAFRNSSKGPAKQAPIAGNPVYRMNQEKYLDNHAEWVEGTTCVLLGSWKVANHKGEKGVAASHGKKVPHTLAQSVNVCVQAEPARARALLEQIDWSPLKSLLGSW